ncbi:MAG: complex I subunit 1 family protein [Candidatus Krumholzibacteriia bacterium]
MELVVETLLKILFMFLVIMGLLPPLIWAERKGAAFIQDRTGPNRASILGIRLAGLVHPIADVFKLVFKEDIKPRNRHRVLYALAPFVVMAVALSTYAVIPFGDYLLVNGRPVPLVVADLSVGILYILAIASLATYGVVMGGWASNNKFTFLGGVRASAQMISYEITMGLAVMGLLLIFGTLRLTEIAAGQGQLLFGFLPMWGVVLQPLGFILFLTSVFAETNRNPFDLPEGESEIVAGFHLEYSSLKFALFFMAEYAHMIVAAAIIATLFFGGYQIPWLPRPVLEANAGPLLTLTLVAVAAFGAWAAAAYFRRAQRERGKFRDARDREPAVLGVVAAGVAVIAVLALLMQPWSLTAAGSSLYATVAQVGAFLGKVVFFSWFFIWVRWTLPRFRYDQLMSLGWKIMLPLGLVNLVVTALVVAAVR